MKLGMQAGLGPALVLDEDPTPPLPKGHSTPQFSAHICCDQMARWIKMPLGRQVGLDPSDTVLDGDPAPPPKKGAEPPIFGPCLLSPNSCVHVGLGPGHILLDGDPAPPPPKGHSHQFSAHICCGQIAGWIKMTLGMEVGLGPGDCVRWGPSSPPQTGIRFRVPLPNFRPVCIVAKQLDGSRCHLVWR